MDQELQCINSGKREFPDCEQMFVFTERDQQFYEERDFTPPKRCRTCRVMKKKSYEAKERQQNQDEQY